MDSDSAATTGNVSADLREKLIAFLQREHPEALPRRRYETVAKTALQTEEPRELRSSHGR